MMRGMVAVAVGVGVVVGAAVEMRAARIEDAAGPLPVVDGTVSEQDFPCGLPELWTTTFGGGSSPSSLRVHANVTMRTGAPSEYTALQVVPADSIPGYWDVMHDTSGSAMEPSRRAGLLLDGYPCATGIVHAFELESPFGTESSGASLCIDGGPAPEVPVLGWELQGRQVVPGKGGATCVVATYTAAVYNTATWLSAPWNSGVNQTDEGGEVLTRLRSYGVRAGYGLVGPDKVIGSTFAKDRILRVAYTFETQPPPSPPGPRPSPARALSPTWLASLV